jgi:hypothetical protein
MGLGAVVGVLYLDQLLFTVYVVRVHHGDTSFVGRYLPRGWFAPGGGPVIDVYLDWRVAR